MAIKKHLPPEISQVRGRNREGRNKLVGPGGKFRRSKQEIAEAQTAYDERIAKADEAIAKRTTEIAEPLHVSRERFNAQAARLIDLYLQSIERAHELGDYKAVGRMSLEALEKIASLLPDQTVEPLFLTTTPVGSAPSAPTIMTNILIGGTKRKSEHTITAERIEHAQLKAENIDESEPT